MKAILRMGVQAALTLAAFGVMSGNARSDVVQIDDLLDGPPIVTADNQAQVAILATGPEFVHFTFTEPNPPSAFTSTFYKDFLEVGGALSDRVIFSTTLGSPVVDVQFASDPQLLPIPPNGINLGPVLEDGTFQLAFTYNNSLVPNTNYFVRSDVTEGGDVPEPSSLALLAVGGLALAAGWRRTRELRPLA